ncbi:MAG TPA: hypothetical protein PL009_07370 [Flavipsychrobacter sp.]|nr:hypothetical protein [Flavipsychrobacter sp.]
MVFELPLTEEKVKRQQVIALHLIVTFTLVATGAFLLLIQYLLNSLSGSQREAFTMLSFPSACGAVTLLAGATLLVLLISKSRWIMEKKTNRVLRIIELGILLCFASFAAMNDLVMAAIVYGIVAAAILFAFYWESISDNTLYIHVDERGIKLPLTSRKRFLEWWEVEIVLLRFGVLTIECCDNRLFQWNIKAINFDKESFQRFCHERIANSKEKRTKYAW